MFSELYTKIVDLLFPRMCVQCGIRGTLLCGECLGRLPRAEPSKESFVSAVFSYQNQALRRLIWKFKYKNARGVAQYFGEALYHEILGALSEELLLSKSERVLLVPIPLHKKRLHERGYNQSELLALEIMKCAKEQGGEEFFQIELGALIRTRKTKPQAKKEKRSARFENLRGAFVCSDPSRVRGRTVILIDDVTTTGATFVSAKSALSSARPRKVLAFAVAH
ncbi:MAG: phosphoribosyltransferase family protein [bacterium]|nr:phosphoribosyltransferase family protein [bacterium]